MLVSIDNDRLRRHFEEYSDIGATEAGGLHRLTLTESDKRARDQFVDDCEHLGLDVRVDSLGNIFARYEGKKDIPPVMIGSHLDSQPNGGRFDGQLGVLAALETVATFCDEGLRFDRPIEIVNWTNEEGSRFQPSMMGSGAFAGMYDPEKMRSVTDADGQSVGEELASIGYDGDMPCESRELHSYLELHIEQGPRLVREGVPVGVVEGVFGQGWLRATVTGESDHSGPTPMDTRKDAMQAASQAINQIGTLPMHLSEDAVATVGELTVNPNSINIIPGEVTFTIDLRSYDETVIDEAVEKTELELATACKRHGCTYELQTLQRHEALEFSYITRNVLSNAADTLSIDQFNLVSGAGHDAQHLQAVTDAGLVFVPSVNGKTHVEEEYTEWDDCIAGAAVLAEATRQLASY